MLRALFGSGESFSIAHNQVRAGDDAHAVQLQALTAVGAAHLRQGVRLGQPLDSVLEKSTIRKS